MGHNRKFPYSENFSAKDRYVKPVLQIDRGGEIGILSKITQGIPLERYP